jgi:2-polyprenyl-6-methoxyphenol hydroxylase-like FAD-dependent oxidoreductase
MPQKPISIIGSGIAGLTLGRALLNHGINATIYTRQPASSRNSYAITLYASAYQRLLNVLGIDEADFRQRVAVPGKGHIDASRTVGAPVNSSISFRAHRGKLEDLLREGLDIKWEHAVDKVEVLPSESTVLHMSKGESIKGTTIIGADGPHSKVRSGLLPQIELAVLPYVAFNGKRRVPLATFDEHYAPAFGDSSVFERKFGDIVLWLSIFDRTDENVSISWVYSRPANGDNDALHKPSRSTGEAKETPEEFFDEVESLPSSLEPFKDIFDTSKLRKDRILHWLMRTVEIPSEDLVGLSRQNVVLLGDAAHAEQIIGGNGANNAIVDAIELAEVLALSDAQGDLAAWSEEHASKWQRGVKESTSRISQMHGAKEANL